MFFYCEDVHQNDQQKSKYNPIEIKRFLMDIKKIGKFCEFANVTENFSLIVSGGLSN